MNTTDPTIFKLAQLISELAGRNADTPATVTSARFVTISLAAAQTGLSQKAIRRKIESGVWLEHQEWIRGKDGRIYIDMKGFTEWVEKAAA